MFISFFHETSYEGDDRENSLASWIFVLEDIVPSTHNIRYNSVIRLNSHLHSYPVIFLPILGFSRNQGDSWQISK